MHVLFVHPNFPAQFRHIAPGLAARYRWLCTFATARDDDRAADGVAKVIYRPIGGPDGECRRITAGFETAVAHARGVFEALKDRPDVQPDLVVAHSGFGSSLYVPHLYDAPVINFFEYLFRASGQSFGYRPDATVTEASLLRNPMRNAVVLLDLDNCDRGWCPNHYQRSVFPPEYHGKIDVLPEGIDTHLYRRNPGCPNTNDANAARRLPDGTLIPAGTRIVTYVSRGLEAMRGFDVFMKAAKRIYSEFPNVRFIIVGENKSYYGGEQLLHPGKSFREHVLASEEFDLTPFHFTGWIPEADLVSILSLSDLHVYLTEPFVTSWSMLDAMSCSCVVLASDQACTREYITHGVNGLLCDFFDIDGIARQALEVLRDPGAFRHLGESARRTIEEKYSLDVCLPRIKTFFETVAAAGPRTPSVRADRLVRAGSLKDGTEPAEKQAERRPDPADDFPHFDGAIPFIARASASCSASAERTSGMPAADAVRHGQDARLIAKIVLFCWELGGGLGHLMQMLPLAEDLVRRGYRVLMALRSLDRATADVLGRIGVSFLQAPVAASDPGTPPAVGYAQLLSGCGFADGKALFARACAWRNLFRFARPGLILFDHAATALLASAGLPWSPRRAVIGSGFCVPPGGEDDGIWAAVRPGAPAADRETARAEQGGVLDRVNRVLLQWKQPPLERLGELYAGVNETFLTTFPELDHFAGRSGSAYWGPVLAKADAGGGDAPRWPDGPGKRVFAYLKKNSDARDVLRELKRAASPTLAFVGGLPAAARRRMESPTLRLADRRVDVAAAARECDLAVLNGGHGVTAEMLLAGKPILQVPLNLEQQMTGAAVARMGAGGSAPARRGAPWQGSAKLEALLTEDRYAQAARRFADRYAAFDRDKQRAAMLDRAEELLAGAAYSGNPSEAPNAAELAAV